jgi:hypothetical protein
MISRLTFLAIAIFWATMNVLLWRMEYGQQGGDIPIPLDLVWRKILSAPDPSSLSVYDHGERTGYCEVSTSVQQAMAKLDADRPPPEGLVSDAGYQLHVNGNLSFGDFTNRLKFDGRILFNRRRDWQEFHLRLILHETTTEIHCYATNRTMNFSLSGPDAVIKRQLSFDDLQNPQALIHALGGDLDSTWLAFMELPTFAPANSSSFHFTARRSRMKLGREPVSVYRVETSVLGQSIVLDVSTIGEIMRVELPNGLTATIDPT